MEPNLVQTQIVPGSAGTPSASGAPPAIPDFTLVRPIGRGSYGEVWLARSVSGAYRALKIVYRRSFEDDKPFEREFRGLLRFEPISRLHDSQVDILHIGRNDDAGYFYYAMELADDLAQTGDVQADLYAPRTLQTELAGRGRLRAADCLRLGIQLATALEHLHRHGLTHRDIKPSNIVYVGGVPKLADIGLVAELAGTQSVVGTLGFAPPEGPGTIRADIYALGKVLYEAAFGRDRKEFPELPTDLREWPECQKLLELNQVLIKACDPAAAKRYDKAESLRQDLELLQRGESVAGKRRREKARRIALRSIACLAIAAAVLSGLWMVNADLQRRALDRRVTRHIASGTWLLDQRDPAGALLYFSEALQLTPPNQPGAQAHRIRCAAVLAQCPTLQQAFAHPGLTTLDLSPNETRVVTASADGTALVRDARTGKVLLPALRHGAAPIHAVAFSPNGEFIVTGGGDKLARVWNAATGKVSRDLQHEQCVWCVTFSRDGTRLFTASASELHSGPGGGISVWDLSTGALLRSKAATGVRSLAVSRDSHRLLTASEDGTARVWDASTLEELIPPFRADGPLHMAAFSRSEERIVTASYDGSARLWNNGLQAGTPAGGALRHGGPVLWAGFGSDPTRLLTTSSDQSVRLWSVAGGREQLLWAFKTASWVGHASWSADGKRLLLAHGDGIARLWLLPAVNANAVALTNGAPIFHVEFSGDGRLALTCGGGEGEPGQARIWDAATGAALGSAMSHQAPVIFAAFSPDRSRVVTASPDRTARIWDTDGKPLTPPLRHDGPVWQAAFSPDARRVVTASGENGPGEARIWNVETGELLVSIPHDSDVMAVAFSPEGRHVASAGGASGGPGLARVWDAATGRPESPWLKHPGTVWHVSFSPDGKRLATTGADQSARLWEAASGAELAIVRHAAPIRCLQFAPDGQRILTASLDKTARAWDSRSGNPLTPPLNHAGPVTDACFSPVARWILTGCADGSARVWDASNGEPLTPLLWHNGAVQAVAFAPDNARILTGGADGIAQIYRLSDQLPSTADLRLLAEAISGRRMSQDGNQLVPLTPMEARARADAAVAGLHH